VDQNISQGVGGQIPAQAAGLSVFKVSLLPVRSCDSGGGAVRRKRNAWTDGEHKPFPELISARMY